MITEDALQELQKSQRVLEEMMQPAFEDELIDVFFGLCQDEWGWHYVSTDYPGYMVHFMGSTYESAIRFIEDQILAEYLLDIAEDEEEE